jgi:hypothetical protein
MATMISVRDAEALAQQLAVVTARMERHAMMIDNVVERLEVLERETLEGRARGGA